MPELRLSELRAELSATHHDARVRRMMELGRRAATDPGAKAALEGLAQGDAYERRLALAAEFTRRDGAHVLRATSDASGRIRALAFRLVPLACDDAQALEALKMAYAMRREGAIQRGLVRQGRQGVIDAYLDWLAARAAVPDFADAVPLGARSHPPAPGPRAGEAQPPLLEPAGALRSRRPRRGVRRAPAGRAR
ncbi:hypothetical protein ACLESD_44795 [Pyxidicoccus sp. 3LFB2]